MSTERWYLGRVNRTQAEEIVTKAGIDGSFVVRASESINGAYALSVWFGGTIHTYRILPTEAGLLAVQTIKGVQQRKFTSLTELITEYKNPQNGLVCGLTNPVGAIADIQTPAPPPPIATPVPVLRVPSVAFPPPTQPAPINPSTLRKGVKVLPEHPTIQREREMSSPPVPVVASGPRPSFVATNSKVNIDSDLRSKFKTRANNLREAWAHDNTTFMDTLEQYAGDGIFTDMESAVKGTGRCVQLQHLLAKEAGQLESELELFLSKIDALRQLVDLGSDIRSFKNYGESSRDVDLESFLVRLGDCGTVVKALNKRACNQLQVAAGVNPKPSPSITRKVSRRASILPEEVFEVKVEGLKTSRQKLKIDVNGGRLMIIKSDGPLEYKHDQVVQIVKNNKSQNKLSIVFDGGKKRDYIFERKTQREAFCQLMQHMMNVRSPRTEPDNISVFVGTWNMGDALPPAKINSWFECNGTGITLDSSISDYPHDLYVIGTQETGMPEKDWMHRVVDTIYDVTGEKMHLVTMDALWHIKIIVLVREDHKHRISHVHTSTVKTGIANALGNKGAVAVSLQFGGTPLCFINAHLTSGNEKCSRRNQNYHDIVRQLSLGSEQLTMFDLTNRFEHLVFLGDLNYRLEMGVQEILQHIKSNKLETLHKVDQLRREKELNKVFFGFKEEEIKFPPTYRYERGNREVYSYLKIKRTGPRTNVPSWCDRVLWKSYPDTYNVCQAYGCTDDIMTSDHSPVFATFRVGVRGQYVSNEGIRRGSQKISEAHISFENVEIRMKNPMKGSYHLELRSTCLTEAVRSTRITCDSSEPNLGHLFFDQSKISKLKPIIGDSEYLVDQHILVAVKNEDDDYLSECVLALRSMIGTEPQNFEQLLTRRGEASGSIRGRMHVITSGNKTREKTYEFIQIGGGIREESLPTSIYSSVDEPTVNVNMSKSISARTQKSTELKRNSKATSLNHITMPEQPANIASKKVEKSLSNPDRGQGSSSSSPSSTSSRDLDAPLPLPRPRSKVYPSPDGSTNLDDMFLEFNKNADALFDNGDKKALSPPIMPTPSLCQPFTRGQPPPPSGPAPILNTQSAQSNQSFLRQDSIDYFLHNLGLSRYASAMIQKGWDSYEFLSDITAEDLQECGVCDVTHIKTILDAVAKLE